MRRRAIDKPFQNWTYSTKLDHHPMYGPAFGVDAIACACGGKFVNEIETFLTSVRAHHNEKIYLLTDKSGEIEINRVIDLYKFENITIWPDVDLSYSKKVERLTKNIKSHSNYWSITWIYAKIDVMTRALAEEVGAGVLLLDSDIILNERIEDKWRANLVLSAHSLSVPLRDSHKTYGFWNAGMIAMNRLAVANDWMRLFLNGGSETFYEQKPLEEMSKKWVTETFKESHNFGKWKREDLAMSRRKVSSFHLHSNEGQMYPEQVYNHRLSNISIYNNKKTCEMIKDGVNKLAFIHIPRSGGTSLRNIIKEGINKNSIKMQLLDSWILELNREWHEDELIAISNKNLYGQNNFGRYFVHNHLFGWSERAVRSFNNCGYTTFTLIRDVRDTLCSIWFYHLDNKELSNDVIYNNKEGNNELNQCKDINEALIKLLTSPNLIPYWALPNWFDKISLKIKFTEDNVKGFLKNYLGHSAKFIKKENNSSNSGYNNLVRTGEISDMVIEAIESDPKVKRWDSFYNASE